MEPVLDVEVAARCQCCGGYTSSALALAQPPALLAVCDVLVIRALEQVGKRIVRVERSRFRTLNNRPWHTAHTIWRPEDTIIDKGLAESWDVIPAMMDVHGCCGVTSRQVTQMIDSYVRDLLVTGTAHSFHALHYRFERFLGVPVAVPSPPSQFLSARSTQSA